MSGIPEAVLDVADDYCSCVDSIASRMTHDPHCPAMRLIAGAVLDASGFGELMAERDRLRAALQAQADAVVPAQVDAVRGIADGLRDGGAIGTSVHRAMHSAADAMTAKASEMSRGEVKPRG